MWRKRMGRFTWRILGLLFAAGVLVVILGGYLFGWPWTGLQPTKTFWDWMQLLIIPAVLAGVATWFNWKQSQTEHELADARQQEAVLDGYLDTMSVLLLEKHLREAPMKSEIREVARVRTLTALGRVDRKRKGIILRFLYESKLIRKMALQEGAETETDTIIDLYQADLREADLRGIDLSGADLGGADLSGADLSGADLSGDNLNGVILTGANLEGASLLGADLRQADLEEAKVQSAQLAEAKSLKNALMPDSSKHE